MTPVAQPASAAGTSIAPTTTSDPRGSFTTAERKRSCCSRKHLSCSATLPPPRSGPPPITVRVGSPPVCESMTKTRFIEHNSRSRSGNCNCAGLFPRPISTRHPRKRSRYGQHEHRIKQELSRARRFNKSCIQVRKNRHQEMSPCDRHQPQAHDGALQRYGCLAERKLERRRRNHDFAGFENNVRHELPRDAEPLSLVDVHLNGRANNE